ncbi:MAG TPA: hypothetical protein VFY15_05945 [Acidimicrobiia bacterium]|nr:hypothetical protein [Acidimicrobiia bacterium]
MRLLVVLALVTAACGGGTPTLPDTLGPISDEVRDTVGGLTRILDDFYPSRVTLYENISALEVTAAAGDLYDRVSRLEEATLAADLQRYTRFVGELLLASGDIDTAVGRDKLDTLALEWLGVEAAAGVLAVGLDPRWCTGVTPEVTADLCRPELPDGYDASVERAVRLFLARYRPLVRLPTAFGDGVRAVVAMELRAEVLASIDAAMQDLAALTPPDDLHRRLHESFVAHLGDIREIWDAMPQTPDALAAGHEALLAGQVDANPPLDGDGWIVLNDGVVPDVVIVIRTMGGGDGQPIVVAEVQAPPDAIWIELSGQLTAAACDGAGAFAAARTPLRTAHPGSTLPALGEMWFYGEGTGCP